MTIKECEPRIEVVKQRFRNYFQTDFDAEVFLLGKTGTCDKRNALFEICRETYFEYLPGTLGETIGSGIYKHHRYYDIRWEQRTIGRKSVTGCKNIS